MRPTGSCGSRCRSSDGRILVVETKRLIKAYGIRVMPNDPLEISSERVQSVSPDFCDMRGDDMRASDTPVWVIGGGKTAMDTAHALITEYPGREVNLVAGSGTFFACRDQFFPTGVRRWWDGTPVRQPRRGTRPSFRRHQREVVWDWHRDNYGTWLTPETGNFLAGVLSKAENKTIAEGLNDVIMDHFVDAVDRNGSTEMVLRSGATKAIQPGSWIVNCTGYLDAARVPLRALCVRQRSRGLDPTAFCHTSFDVVRGLLPDAPAVPGQDKGRPAVRTRRAGDLRRNHVGFPVRAFRDGAVQPQPDRRQRPDQGVHSTADSISTAGIRCHAA